MGCQSSAVLTSLDMKPRLAAGILAVSLAAVGVAIPASAHISLEQGGTHMSRYGDGALKEGPCGKAGGKRGTNVYTYEPGTTITVSLVEFIPHPGYFRFAFDDDGDDGFKDPVSILPVDPKRKCPDGPGDHCGTSDFYNTPSVLPEMDNLNPHLSRDALPKNTFQVKLPNVECSNCTLQVIQVMEDDDSHGPFDTTPGVGVSDVYHQCIDLVLKHGAPADPGPDLDAGPGAADAGSSAVSIGHDDGGCSIGRGTAGLSSAAVLALALGALWSRRRSPRS
jgi:hypothetical protein